MTADEREDLLGILTDGRRLDARDDCLRILRELPWDSPEEKLAFWESLPELMRAWLAGGGRRSQTAAS